MGKLLEFKPQEASSMPVRTTTVATRIALDVCYGCTPDLPILRFAGPQPVFIWDELRNTERMKKAVGARQDDGWSVDHYVVYTIEKFLPVCINGQTYIPSDRSWVKDEDAIGHFDSRPISGRVISCSLKTLQQLDGAHCNGERSRRQLIKLDVGNNSSMYAWAYISSAAMMEDLLEEGEPEAIGATRVGQRHVYEVDAYRRLLA